MEGVRVEVLSSTSVNVSWIPLQSSDIANYLVDYFQVRGTSTDTAGQKRRQASSGNVAGTLEFPGNTSWGVVDNLVVGSRYNFQVTAAVMLNGGVRVEGAKSLLSGESAIALTPPGKGEKRVGQGEGVGGARGSGWGKGEIGRANDCCLTNCI